MSKIAEKRTDEIIGEYHDGDYTDHSRHNTQWVAFKQGYEQAMQDIMEKAVEWLQDSLDRRYVVRSFHTGEYYSIQDMIKDFKNYIQNESEN